MTKTYDLPAHDAPSYRVVCGTTLWGRQGVECNKREDAKRFIEQLKHNPLAMWIYVES